MNYVAKFDNKEDKLKCDEYFTREEEKFNHFYQTIREWISRVEDNLVTASLQVDSDVKPEDSVSCARRRTSNPLELRELRDAQVEPARALVALLPFLSPEPRK